MQCREGDRRVKFSAKGHVHRVRELRESGRGEAHLLPANDCRYKGRRTIGPLDWKPNVPAARVLSVDVPLPILAADSTNDR